MTTPEPEPDATLDSRVTTLEHGQVAIDGKLDRLLGLFSDKGTPDAPAEPERPEVNIAQEIRDGLAALAAQGKAPEPAAPKPADLTEKPPKPQIRRVTKAIWGDDE